ncbi:hypothetical protein GCM10022251_17400 [Phytohabitans flavus]|uniref:DUF4190 domain-containing protein n=1 Tax=Phytohabitans flavus TaxID=1076124 RepID=A0A6F8Y609_9ACTN|nr:hypothetical protein [Phytohabitans flavus]BCB81497.1 hypothetical protein Pflav_079070 [Phytohabitans flavus]
MTTPYPPPPAAQPANDRTTLWGVLGIVIGLICCWPAGIVFGVLALQEAKKAGKPPTLAYIAFAASALNLIGSIIYWTSR